MVTVVVAPVVVASVVDANVDVVAVVVASVVDAIVEAVVTAIPDVSAVIELLARAKAIPKGIKTAPAARTAITQPEIIQNHLCLFLFALLSSSLGNDLCIASVSVQICF